MKKRSLSHFAYYAANRAFPVFLLLLLLLGFTACSAEKGARTQRSAAAVRKRDAEPPWLCGRRRAGAFSVSRAAPGTR